jgi:hypothetical protein
VVILTVSLLVRLADYRSDWSADLNTS